MNAGYYTWIAVLRDGSTVNEMRADGTRVSLVRSDLAIATLTLQPVEGCALHPVTVHIPEGGRAIFFKTFRSMAGFAANRNFPGLFYIATSQPVGKLVASAVRDWEQTISRSGGSYTPEERAAKE